MGFYFPFLERRQLSNKNMGCFFKVKRMAVEMEAETEGHSVEKSVTGRNEMAEQLEECEGLGAAAAGGEPGAAGGKGGGEREAVYFLYCLNVPFF